MRICTTCTALALIRDAIEELAPVGAMRSSEAVMGEHGPEPQHEAAELIRGIPGNRGGAERVGEGRAMGEVHIFHDPDAMPQEWRVEEIDSDGGCDVVIFTGPHAEQRAKEFAEELRSQSRPN